MSDDDDDDYWDSDDEGETRPCPYCKAEIYEDVPQCPACEQYLTDFGQNSSTSQPLWVKLTVVLLLALFAYWALAPLF